MAYIARTAIAIRVSDLVKTWCLQVTGGLSLWPGLRHFDRSRASGYCGCLALESAGSHHLVVPRWCSGFQNLSFEHPNLAFLWRDTQMLILRPLRIRRETVCRPLATCVFFNLTSIGRDGLHGLQE